MMSIIKAHFSRHLARAVNPEGADFSIYSVQNRAKVTADASNLEQLVQSRETCFDELLCWSWMGHGESFGGLAAMLSHGDASKTAESPAQIAMTKLSGWAATILNDDVAMHTWLDQGVGILKNECELALDDFEKKVCLHSVYCRAHSSVF